MLLYLESFGNPRRFGRIARRVARTKPILAMKSGVTGAGSRAASSHTAALAGSEAAVSALFRQAGVTRCDTLEELIDVAALFSSQPPLQGTTSRGADERGRPGDPVRRRLRRRRARAAAAFRGDTAALAGVLPQEASTANPIDMLGSASADLYEAGRFRRCSRTRRSTPSS